MNYINKEYYLPLLDEFYRVAGDDLKKCGYDQNPFVPYTFSNYNKAERKVFFIGQDTFYWEPQIEEPYNQENLNKYLERNAASMTLDKIPNWGNKTCFWGMVARLQLMLHLGSYKDDITILSDDEWDIVSEIGYGNLNSIELLSTIKKRGECEITNLEAYYRVVEAAAPLQSLVGILNAYHPDLVFVLAWSGYANELIDAGFLRQEKLLEKPFRDVYIHPTTKQVVIWSNHPSSYSFKRTYMEEMCIYLRDTYLKVTGNK